MHRSCHCLPGTGCPDGGGSDLPSLAAVDGSLTRVRSGGDGAGGLGPAVQQQVHHGVRIKVTGIDTESDIGQVIEAPLDDILELVDRPALGRGLDLVGEGRGLGVGNSPPVPVS